MMIFKALRKHLKFALKNIDDSFKSFYEILNIIMKIIWNNPYM